MKYFHEYTVFSVCVFITHIMLITGSNQYGSILGHTSVTTGSLLDDNHWHSVVIERYRRNVNFTLDRHTQHFRTNGEFDHLDLDYEVSSVQLGKMVDDGRDRRPDPGIQVTGYYLKNKYIYYGTKSLCSTNYCMCNVI